MVIEIKWVNTYKILGNFQAFHQHSVHLLYDTLQKTFYRHIDSRKLLSPWASVSSSVKWRVTLYFGRQQVGSQTRTWNQVWLATEPNSLNNWPSLGRWYSPCSLALSLDPQPTRRTIEPEVTRCNKLGLNVRFWVLLPQPIFPGLIPLSTLGTQAAAVSPATVQHIKCWRVNSSPMGRRDPITHSPPPCA
jgi:hypothetical protein